MNFKTGIFMLVASVACLWATESESHAQGGQLALRAARAYAVRAIPGGGIARFAIQRGVRNNGGFGGVQGFGAGTQGFGNQGFNQGFGNQGFGAQRSSQFGLRGLQAARIFRRF